MNKKTEQLKNFRIFLLRQMEGLTTRQLNEIPPGFNNNVIWNLGHLLGVQQNMCYVRAGLPITIDERYFSPFMPGTKPEQFIDEAEIQVIKDLLITSIDKLQADLDKKIFVNYSPSVMIPKVYGFEVTNIDEALSYLLHHEGFHAGCILSMKRLV